MQISDFNEQKVCRFCNRSTELPRSDARTQTKRENQNEYEYVDKDDDNKRNYIETREIENEETKNHNK